MRCLVLLRHAYQCLAHFMVQTGIGWECNGFLLNRGIGIDLIDIAPLQMAATFGCGKKLF